MHTTFYFPSPPPLPLFSSVHFGAGTSVWQFHCEIIFCNLPICLLSLLNNQFCTVLIYFDGKTKHSECTEQKIMYIKLPTVFWWASDAQSFNYNPVKEKY